MSLLVNDAIQNNSPKPVDNKYGIFSSGSFRPYANVAEANATIPAAYRSVGLTVLVVTGGGNTEYWYQAGIADGNLIPKSPTSSVAAPIIISSGSIAIQPANTSQGGYLTNSDWNTFNGRLSGATSIGGAIPIYASISSGVINIKSLVQGTNMTITDNGTTLTLTPATVSGTNVGTGAAIFSGLSGTNLQMRSFIVTGGLTITQNTSDITLGIANSFLPNPIVTSDATPTALTSITIEDSSAGLLEVTVVGIIVGATNNCTIAKRYVQYYKQGGVLTIAGGVGDLIPEVDNGSLSTTSWTLTANGSTNNFDITVTGQVATNIKWTTKVNKVFNT